MTVSFKKNIKEQLTNLNNENHKTIIAMNRTRIKGEPNLNNANLKNSNTIRASVITTIKKHNPNININNPKIKKFIQNHIRYQKERSIYAKSLYTAYNKMDKIKKSWNDIKNGDIIVTKNYNNNNNDNPEQFYTFKVKGKDKNYTLEEILSKYPEKNIIPVYRPTKNGKYIESHHSLAYTHLYKSKGKTYEPDSNELKSILQEKSKKARVIDYPPEIVLINTKNSNAKYDDNPNLELQIILKFTNKNQVNLLTERKYILFGYDNGDIYKFYVDTPAVGKHYLMSIHEPKHSPLQAILEEIDMNPNNDDYTNVYEIDVEESTTKNNLTIKKISTINANIGKFAYNLKQKGNAHIEQRRIENKHLRSSIKSEKLMPTNVWQTSPPNAIISGQLASQQQAQYLPNKNNKDKNSMFSQESIKMMGMAAIPIVGVFAILMI